MKAIKWFLQSAIIISLACVAYLCGVYVTEYKAIKEGQKSTVTTIAVVNADSGVTVDGEYINYASKLMSYPDVNFMAAGLTEARQGVENNRYAAFILIPGTFSSSIQSINTQPQKAEITYAVNQNLREDAKIKVVNDIHNFILGLSTNISYIYVDSILKEVHSVQNDSKSIMENDTRDMNAVNSIKEEELIVETEYVPIEIVETEIEYMDLGDDFSEADKTVDSLITSYEESVSEAEKAFLGIKANNKTMTDSANSAADVLLAVDILADKDGNSVYEQGEANLSDYADQYRAQCEEKKTAAKLVLGGTVSGGSISENSLSGLQEQITTQIDTLTKAKEESATISENGITDLISGLEAVKNNLTQYSENGIAAVEEIPDGSGMVSDVQTIISDEIAKPIYAECATEADAVSNSMGVLQKNIDGYMTQLEEYDAMSYMDRDRMSELTGSLYSIISNMESDIMKQDDAYLSYVDEVFAATDKNVTALQDSIDTSNKSTQENIFSTMENFKTSRTQINAQNVMLLDGITKKLPYTRLGNLEYAQVYDFIAEPVLENNTSPGTEITPTSVSIDRDELLYVFTGIATLLILYFTVVLVHNKYGEIKNNGEEEEQWQTD